MEIPLYNTSERDRSIQDGNYEIEQFTEFISKLLENEMIDHPTEYGVLKYLDSNSTEDLSTDQMNVLKRIVSRFEKARCMICDDPATWYDMIDEDYSNLCDRHKNIRD